MTRRRLRFRPSNWFVSWLTARDARDRWWTDDSVYYPTFAYLHRSVEQLGYQIFEYQTEIFPANELQALLTIRPNLTSTVEKVNDERIVIQFWSVKQSHQWTVAISEHDFNSIRISVGDHIDRQWMQLSQFTQNQPSICVWVTFSLAYK